MTKKTYIRGRLSKVNSQRLAYKPYGYDISFDGEVEVLVEIEIPSDTVVEEGEDFLVLNLDGLNAILEVTADSLDKLNEKYMKEVQKGGKQ